MNGRTVALGVSVSLISYLVARLVNLGVTIMLARALGPTEMGLIAFALLILEMFDILRDFGLRETLIYDRTGAPGLRTTAFSMIIAVGLIQAVVLLALAPLALHAVEDKVIEPVLMWLAVVFPINALGSVPDALLQRDFRFYAAAKAEILGVIVKGGVAVSFLVTGFGIWSIVIAMIAGASARATTLWIVSDWRPGRRAPTWGESRELFHYGRHIVAIGIVNMVQMRIDQIAIVASVGETALGLYFVAARIPEILVLGVNSVITRVVFPVFSSVADSHIRLVSAYRTTIGASMSLMAPVSLGLAVCADLVVATVFGADWAAASPALFFLALSGVPTSLGWTTGDVFKATGRPKYLWIVVVAETAIVMPLLFIGVYFGADITTIAAVMLAGKFISVVLRLTALWRVAGIRVQETLHAAWRPVVSAIAMALLVQGVIIVNPLQSSDGFLLIQVIATGMVAYAALLFILDRETLMSWYDQVFESRK
jgi:PST family polysaccharide transporter